MKDTNYQIQYLTLNHCNYVKKFTDRWVGQDYYSLEDLVQIVELSHDKGITASLLAFDGDELVAIRLSLAPGKWQHTIHAITPQKWDAPMENVAYFKSLFVASSHQKKGLGKLLSSRSIEILKEMGTKAIVCHSWLESPDNSSQIYLKRMDFQEVNSHPKFWNHINYLCTRCAPHPCVCTASEMILYI